MFKTIGLALPAASVAIPVQIGWWAALTGFLAKYMQGITAGLLMTALTSLFFLYFYPFNGSDDTRLVESSSTPMVLKTDNYETNANIPVISPDTIEKETIRTIIKYKYVYVPYIPEAAESNSGRTATTADFYNYL